MKNLVWKSFAAQEVSHSMAHYMSALRDLGSAHGYARISDVARELQVTKGAASLQMKHLKQKGFVVEDPNKFLRLTSLGEAVVREVGYSRHILIQFLTEVLGIEAHQAETDACKIEHLLSLGTVRKLLGLVQLLQSSDPGARRLVRRIKRNQLRCTSKEECKLCDDECLLEADVWGLSTGGVSGAETARRSRRAPSGRPRRGTRGSPPSPRR